MDCNFLESELATKVVGAVGGLLGGVAMIMLSKEGPKYRTPCRLIVSAMVGGLGANILLERILHEPIHGVTMAAGFALGFVAWFLLGATARFFERREDKDIVEIVKDARDATK